MKVRESTKSGTFENPVFYFCFEFLITKNRTKKGKKYQFILEYFTLSHFISQYLTVSVKIGNPKKSDVLLLSGSF